MTKYVIDLPDGTTAVVATKSSFLHNETDMMRIPVSQLEMYVEPSAAEYVPVEKRVIELPADLIKLLVEHKRGRSIFGFLNYLINETGDPSLITELTDELGTAYISITQDVLAEWYLGHVEFVPKNEPKFYIRIFDVFDVDGNDLYLASMGNNKFRMTIYTDSAGMFTEEEADKIIADVSNSDVSLTARKVKVEA